MQITQDVLQRFGKDQDDSTNQTFTETSENTMIMKGSGSGIKGEDIDGIQESPLNKS